MNPTEPASPASPVPWNQRALVWMGKPLLLLALLGLGVQQLCYPIRQIHIGGTLVHYTPVQLQEKISPDLLRRFLNTDLDAIQHALLEGSGVRQVVVRRHWPDQIDIMVEEHQAVARWYDGALVNAYGERFRPATPTPTSQATVALALLEGPEDSGVEMVRFLQRADGKLARLGRRVEHIRLSGRRAWKLWLDNQLVLELGRDTPQERLDRFVAAYPSLLDLRRPLTYVDLRYVNGFAVLPQPPGRTVR